MNDMKKELLDLLSCPICKNDYALTIHRTEDKEIMEGDLVCRCGKNRIVRGVPRLVIGQPDSVNVITAERFGEEWKQFSMLTDQYEKQFLSWIEPVRKEHFNNKVVLDVGCGKGRHILQAKLFGASQVVGIDLSQAVDVAFNNVGKMEGVHIVQADIYNLPFKRAFDYAYSIGVLHHTPDPAKSFSCMVEKIKFGGSVSAWVYGREGNGWIVYLLNPIRSVTSKLPLAITKALAFILAVVMQILLICVYRPAAKLKTEHWLRHWLPYSAYLCSISGYSFKENFSIAFDHLLPEIAFYIRKDEFERWFMENKLKETVITQRYGNSWRGFAKKYE